MISKITLHDLQMIETIGKSSLPIYYESSDLYFLLFDSKYQLFKYQEKEITVGFIIIEQQTNNYHIMSLAVQENYRRKGIATKLIQYLLNQFDSNFSLYVLEDNKTAQQLYEKNGFINIGLIEDYYESLQKNAFLYEYHKIKK